MEKSAPAATGEAQEGGNYSFGYEDNLPDELKKGFTPFDKKDMHRMGKKQEFRRNFKMVSAIGFTTCVMGTWEIALTSNNAALTAGGKAGYFWSLVWCAIGQAFIVLSIAEMASMAPTAGGQYHWVSEFAPPRIQKSLSYISGWLSTICWQSIIAAGCWVIGNIILALASINNVDFAPTLWQATLIIFAVVIAISLFNIFAAKQLPLAEGLFALFHILAWFPIVITLLVLSPKDSGRNVFLTFTDNGAGWPNLGWGAFVGQVSAMWTLIASDSVAHMSEEVENASVIVPRSMVIAYALNVPFAFGIILTYLFCLDSIDDAVTDPTGFAFIYVFKKATNSAGGASGLTVIILVLMVMITISSLASTSRQTFAFARDKGLPFHNWLGHVHPRLHVPVNSIIFSCTYTILISLINVGSTVAFFAIVSLGTSALMATYLISIGCVAYRRFTGMPLPKARWSLGKWGIVVNYLGIIYASWALFWGFWPTFKGVTPENFNWAVVLFVGLMLIAAILYFVQARHVYEGPVSTVEGRRRDE
ncbi:putative amino acid transporter [Eremomyces bilateralis CBS 781.70]|uniref:Amino acid transporter n=1 Tax=Eremomyces bilateralis CBS 781.70 TaxID=1392243 RepID=A0A6G1GHQ7_9PEZI|nr:putative amino acid transporter [Eremomyces bilateralis CBS 781.70]KAF1817486.1 putative amino acid transporter [Eremomyces bilateralis CBS 781.70]